MSILTKTRARKPLFVGAVTVALYPNGVGGIDGHEPCVALCIGPFKLSMKTKMFDGCVEQLRKLRDMEGVK